MEDIVGPERRARRRTVDGRDGQHAGQREPPRHAAGPAAGPPQLTAAQHTHTHTYNVGEKNTVYTYLERNRYFRLITTACLCALQ